MHVFVQVYDNNGAFTIYEIESPITVNPDLSNLTNIISNLISANPYFLTNKILNEGSYLQFLQEMLVISSLLNEQSLRDKFGLVSKYNSSLNYFPETWGPVSNFHGVLAVI